MIDFESSFVKKKTFITMGQIRELSLFKYFIFMESWFTYI